MEREVPFEPLRSGRCWRATRHTEGTPIFVYMNVLYLISVYHIQYVYAHIYVYIHIHV